MDTEPRRLAAGRGVQLTPVSPGATAGGASILQTRSGVGAHTLCVRWDGAKAAGWSGSRAVHTQGCCPPSTWGHWGSRARSSQLLSGPGPHPELEEGANGHPLPQRWRRGLLRGTGGPGTQGAQCHRCGPASVSLSPGGKEGNGRPTRYPGSRAPLTDTHAPMMRPPRDRGGRPNPETLSPWCVPEIPRGPAPVEGHRPSPASPAQACLTQDPALRPRCPDPRPRLARGPERAGKGVGPAGPARVPPGPTGRPVSPRPQHTAALCPSLRASHVQPPSAVLWPAPETLPGEPGRRGRGALRPQSGPRPQPP